MDAFVPSGTENDAHRSFDPTKIITFAQVCEDAVNKIVRKPHAELCLLDSWPTFLITECSDTLLPSITKLVNCSVIVERVHDVFKICCGYSCNQESFSSAVYLKNYIPSIRLISKMVEHVVAKQLLEHSIPDSI